MKKFRRVLFIIPIMFTLLLSCVPFLSANAETLGQSFVDEIDTDYSEFATEPYDLSSFINSISKTAITNDLISRSNACKGYYQTSDYYFYSVYWLKQETDYFTNSSSSSAYARLDINFYTIQDLDTVQHDSRFLTYQHACYYRLRCKYYKNGTLEVYDHSYYGTSECFDYCLTTGFCWRGSLSSNQSNLSSYNSNDLAVYSVYEETNIPDFPYAGDYHASSGLNVSVTIEPSLTGTVDTHLMYDGSQQDNAFIRYYVANNGRKRICYSFYIVDHGFDVLSIVNSDPFADSINDPSVRFIHCTEEFQSVIPTEGNQVSVAKGKSRWRNQDPGNNGGKFVAWSQMNLRKNVAYDVVVLAFANDSNYVPTGYYYYSGAIQEVYRSTFSLNRDSGFDPNNNSFGTVPYIPGDSLLPSSFSQYYDQDGNLQVGNFSKKDVLDNVNPDNYVYNGSNGSGGFIDNNGNYVNTSFASLSSSISGFLSFFNCVWSYIPGNYTSLLALSITSLVVIGIFKGVFR